MQTKILRQIDDDDALEAISGLFQELLRLSMTQTKKNNVHLAMPLRVESQAAVAKQILVYRVHRFARIALAMNEPDIDIGMSDQQSDHFTPGIAGAADNACSDGIHWAVSLIL
jgi:hypothetical protein